MSITAEYIRLLQSGRARMEPGLRIDDIRERLRQNGYPDDRIEVLIDGDSEELTRFEAWLDEQERQTRVRSEILRLETLEGASAEAGQSDETRLRQLEESALRPAPEPEPDYDPFDPFPDPADQIRRGPRPKGF